MAQLKNTNINDSGFYKIPAGTTAQRPANASGLIRYNSQTSLNEFNTGAAWIQGNKQATDIDGYGASSTNPAYSGWDLKQKRPNAPSGVYWIKNERMPNALQMYVDMVEEGGGYDFYLITGGTSVDTPYLPTDVWGSANAAPGALHSGVALGLDLIYPRSKFHWRAMDNYVRGVLGQNLNTYFSAGGFIGAIYRNTATTGGTAGGNYTGQIMRDPKYYGSGAQDWGVPDGGRWWLRDSVYSEPNGDYGEYGFLASRGVPQPYALSDIVFNDGGGVGTRPYVTGTSYICSTNHKP
jgi:hypothetical protein